MSASASSRPRPSWSIEARSSSDAARSASSPSWMRTLTRRCWALSCRSRWMRRRSRSAASRARTRARRRSRCRPAVRTRAQAMPPSHRLTSRTARRSGCLQDGHSEEHAERDQDAQEHHSRRTGGYRSGGHPSAPKRASSSLVVLTISLPQQFAVRVRTAKPVPHSPRDTRSGVLREARWPSSHGSESPG